MFPKPLGKGDKIAVIAPSRSMSIISAQTREIAKQRFDDLGLELIFGKNVEESDDFLSSSIESRVEDLHWAFSDKNINGVLTVIGGFNSNQLLKYIDWEIIAENPKVFCGYSDITILCNAILAKTGLVTFYGPHYSTFGQKSQVDYTVDHFQKCVMSKDRFIVEPSLEWSDDEWWIDQDSRNPVKNQGPVVINEGDAEGFIIGGNISTFCLLSGTEYVRVFDDIVLFLEDDCGTNALLLDRFLQSIFHQDWFENVRGLVIGRFQNNSGITFDKLMEIIGSKKELSNLPVVVDFDFGHTEPRFTFPVGGRVSLSADNGSVTIEVDNRESYLE
ncbi:LD-carboxypeptidase [Candidatus Dojkabacteria bacterium]|nr:LD-carboxypeptidase [Candidatus Dojkabacteria bacterium]